MIFTPTNTPKGTVKAACWKSDTRLKSTARSPTVNMLQLVNEFSDSSGRRAHRVQSWPGRTSPTKCVSIRRCAAPHGRDTDHRAQLGEKRTPLWHQVCSPAALGRSYSEAHTNALEDPQGQVPCVGLLVRFDF